MHKQWFVLHTLTGQEYKVRENIIKRVKTAEMEEHFGDVVVPTEQVSEVRRGVKTTSRRKFFPGYVLVQLVLYDDNKQLVDKTWYFIKETPGIIGFLGGDHPVPLPDDEVEQLLMQADERQQKARPKVSFEPGETVKIVDSQCPFVNFNGTVEEVDPERGKLKVSVAIFGRSAPIELEYWQVERA